MKPDGTGDAATIQAAIDSAGGGDEIVVAAGIYSEPIHMHLYGPVMLVLKPGLTLRGESGAESTVLDARQEGGVIFCFDPGDYTIDGLTIMGGGSWSGGGGILSFTGARPTILNCIIRNNANTIFAGGGAISCSDATIRNCQVLDNKAGFSANGGGIACSRTLISGCTIRGNSCGGDPGGQGGGVLAGGSTLEDCWIESNVASGPFYSAGGGIHMDGGAIRRCVFTNNVAEASVDGGAEGGGIYVDSGSCEISDCIFVGNTARGSGITGSGGAIAGDLQRADVSIIRCTLLSNSSGVSVRGAVSNSLIAWTRLRACDGFATYTCNDLFGNGLGDAVCGVDGGGNFNADPEFCATDPTSTLNLLLQSDSPCAPGNHPNGAPCGGIGATAVGCQNVAVREQTWGEVKRLYRR